MDNVTFLEITKPDGTTVEIALIDNGNNAYTSMTKAHYEAQQVANEAKTI